MNIKEIIKQLEAIDNELDKREEIMMERIRTSTRRTKAEINMILIALDNLEKKKKEIPCIVLGCSKVGITN